MSAWLAPLCALVREGTSCVLVTVATVRGSAPRESGTKMIVTATDTRDTVGGGNLELAAIERARAMLAAPSGRPPRAELVRYPLGPDLRQCCGGAVRILFERVDPRDATWVQALASTERAGEPVVVATLASGAHAGNKMVVAADGATGSLGDAAADEATGRAARLLLAASEPDGGARLQRVACARGHALVLLEPVRPGDFHVLVFGAGHVGRALVDVLASVQCHITWVDTRPGQFPDAVPGNVRAVRTDEPAAEVARAAPGSYCVVMTHSHALDYELVERALARGDLAYVGMIGSIPKRIRLVRYLADEGVPAERIDRLTCPIGVPGIGGKEPATIAIAVAAQLLQVRDAAAGLEATSLEAAGASPAQRERRRRALEREAGSG